jgi:hypothetical protein
MGARSHSSPDPVRGDCLAPVRAVTERVHHGRLRAGTSVGRMKPVGRLESCPSPGQGRPYWGAPSRVQRTKSEMASYGPPAAASLGNRCYTGASPCPKKSKMICLGSATKSRGCGPYFALQRTRELKPVCESLSPKPRRGWRPWKREIPHTGSRSRAVSLVRLLPVDLPLTSDCERIPSLRHV